jgi:hypothetical protein
MKQVLGAFLVLAFSIAACNKAPEPKPLTKEQIKKAMDSITQVRLQEASAMAARDLDYRMRIEVKVKADSILNARSKQIKTDSSNKGKVQPQQP